jgi:hypothetical protein
MIRLEGWRSSSDLGDDQRQEASIEVTIDVRIVSDSSQNSWEGDMTDEQVNRTVQHLCEQLHVAVRLKGTEALPPNAKDLGFDTASVKAVLRSALRLAGVTV